MRWIAMSAALCAACAGSDKDATVDQTGDTDLVVDTVDTDIREDTDGDADTDTRDTDTVPLDTDSAPVDTGPDPDFDMDGYPASVDCNDNDPDVNPGAVERCDAIDNNCDNVLDGQVATWFPDAPGVPTDLTAALTGTAGSPALVTLSSAGELVLCPGIWLSRVVVSAAGVTVRSLDDTVYTALDGSGSALETLRIAADDATVTGLVLLNTTGPTARVTNGKTGARFEGVSFSKGSGGALAGGLNLDAGSEATLIAGVVGRNSSASSGGGLLVGDNATLTAQGTIFEQNASSTGGAILLNPGARATLTSVVVRANTGVSRGGGIYMSASSSLTVSRGTFANNVAGEGGTLWATGAASTVSLDGGTAIASSSGGAVVLNSIATAVFTDVVFDGNNTALDGAALRLLGATELTWVRGIIRNSGTGGHGALSVEGGDVSLDTVLFRNNASDSGGGIAVSAGLLSLDGVVFDLNTARLDGGALEVRGGTVSVAGGTWTSQAATRGGGLYLSGGSVSFANVDLAAGTVNNTPNDIAITGGATYSFGANTNLVCDTTGCL